LARRRQWRERLLAVALGAFLHEAFRQGGIDLSWRLIDADASYSDAVAGRRGLERIPKESVGPGDIVFFDLDRSAPPEVQATHEALVIARPREGKVHTAEGNVGHHIVTTRRGLRYVVLAARVTRQAKRAFVVLHRPQRLLDGVVGADGHALGPAGHHVACRLAHGNLLWVGWDCAAYPTDAGFSPPR
jgi:hypothetical protein